MTAEQRKMLKRLKQRIEESKKEREENRRNYL